MRKLEKDKRFPSYVIAGFYILVGVLICSALFLVGSSLAKNPVIAGSLFPASASPKEEEAFNAEVSQKEDSTTQDMADASSQEAEDSTGDSPTQESADAEPVYYSFVTLNTKSALHVRIQPGMDAEIIYRLSPGTTGYVLEIGDGWSLVQTSEITGYVSNQYLQFQEIPAEEYLPEAEDASQ